MSASGRSPAKRGSAKAQLPTVKGSSSPHAVSPYRKAAADSTRSAYSPSGGASWKSTVLPAVPGMSGPAGPAGPVDGPLSPDPMLLACESKALRTWTEAAAEGDAEAQNNLAVSYFRGINGAPKNVNLAADWWLKAAALGFAEAQYNLAVCMLHGRGVSQDEANAVKMLTGASQQDHADAMCLLASLHADGLAGLTKNRKRALELYSKASSLGSEDAQYKKLILDDLEARETELEALQKKIGKINNGFIQLQLERAANEEVSHAYKGAGFFLSNMKSETPARARIEQAKRAQIEIEKLRNQVLDKEHREKAFSEQIQAKELDVSALLDRIAFLEDNMEGAAGNLEALNKKCIRLEASEVQLKNQVKDLLTENTELRAVADWAKNQRVETLKQALSSVVKNTIEEQNEREAQLRTEIQKLRQQVAASNATAGAGSGVSVVPSSEQSDDSAAFLKRVRRDMLMQEVMLKEILMGLRHDEDYYEQVEFLKEAVGRTDDGEKLLRGACEEILDYVDKGQEWLTDDETNGLCDALKRIIKSIHDTKPPGTGGRPITAMQAFADEIQRIRSSVARLSERLVDLHKSSDSKEQKLMQIGVLQNGVSEVAANLAKHKMEVQKLIDGGSFEGVTYAKEQHEAIENSLVELNEMMNTGVDLSPEQRDKLVGLQNDFKTPPGSRIGTTGDDHRRDADVQFRPPSANRGTMTDRYGRGSRSPTGAKGGSPSRGQTRHTAHSTQHEDHGSDDATVEASLTLKLIQESIEKLGETGGQSAEKFDHAMGKIYQRLDKVLVAMGETPGRNTPADGGSRPATPGGTPLQGFSVPARLRTASEAGSQVDESDFASGGKRGWTKGSSRSPSRHEKSTGAADTEKNDDHKANLELYTKLSEAEVSKVKAEMEKDIAELKGRIELLESEKQALDFEKKALEADMRLAQNETKRTNLEMETMQKNVEQRIAFEKAMLRDEIKSAHDSTDKAIAERDKAINDSTALVNHMESELERRKEAFEESARQINDANQELMREVMESFASKVAVHLSVIQADGGGSGSMASESLLSDMAKQMNEVKKEISVKNETLVEMLTEMDTTLKITAKRASRSNLGSHGGGASVNVGDAVLNGSHPGVTAPLPAEEMDAIKADLHFAVAGAMRNVLDDHKGGVVLLNMPDHNKPAGFMHGDGAGALQVTIQENMREQRRLHGQLADDMMQIRARFAKLEEKMDIQLSSVKDLGDGDVVKKEAKTSTKLLYAVQADNGIQSSVESRLLPSLEQDALAESVEEMKELLQSWYRSFSFVSRLQQAVKQ